MSWNKTLNQSWSCFQDPKVFGFLDYGLRLAKIVLWWAEEKICSCTFFCGFFLLLLQQLSLKYLTSYCFPLLTFQQDMGKAILHFMKPCKATQIPVFSALHNETYDSWKVFGMSYTISAYSDCQSFLRICYSARTSLFVVIGLFFIPLLLHTKVPIPQPFCTHSGVWSYQLLLAVKTVIWTSMPGLYTILTYFGHNAISFWHKSRVNQFKIIDFSFCVKTMGMEIVSGIINSRVITNAI